MMNFCFLNNKIISQNQAKLSLWDLGVLRGYSVFEVMRTCNGFPFLLNKHYERLDNSAKELNLKVPVSLKELEKILLNLLKKNKLKEAAIRIVLTGGVSKDGISLGGRPTFFILVTPLVVFPNLYYAKGVKVITHEYLRENPRVKGSNYVQALKLQDLKKKQKAFEIIYICANKILEGSSSNFFVFKKGVLITPKDNVLLGVTRDFVLDLVGKKFKIKERDVKLSELPNVDEVFITATFKKIMPVVQVNGIKIGAGKVGKDTRWLIKEFEKAIKTVA